MVAGTGLVPWESRAFVSKSTHSPPPPGTKIVSINLRYLTCIIRVNFLSGLSVLNLIFSLLHNTGHFFFQDKIETILIW